MFATRRLLKQFMIVFLTWTRPFALCQTDYKASLGSCPTGFTKINNGCYFFSSYATNWTNASQVCSAMATSPDKSHLLSLESQAETVALELWMEINNLNYNYWTDGVIRYTESNTTYAGGYNEAYWDWLDQSATLFSYYDHSEVQYVLDYAVYLYLNSSSAHEYRSAAQTSSMRFICEASVPCEPAENECENNSTCYVNSGRVLCNCLPGYSHSVCNFEIDMCMYVPCKHGATCISKVNNYSCVCTEYFTGRNCTEEIPYSNRQTRDIVMWIFVTIVILVLSFFCLMDLPWNSVIITYNHAYDKRKLQKEQEANEEKSDDPATKSKKSKKGKKKEKTINQGPVTRAQLLNSDREVLKKLQMVMAKPNDTRSRLSSRTVEPTVDNSAV